MKRLAVLVGTLVLVTGSPASGATLLTPGSNARAQPFQRWADRARVATAAEQLEVRLSVCPGAHWAVACTWPAAPAIYFGAGASRIDFVHELGHRFDYRMPETARRAFLRITRDPRPWRSPAGSPHERFADAYALCARSRRRLPGLYASGFGYSPTKRRHRAVCRLIRRVALETPALYDPPPRQAAKR